MILRRLLIILLVLAVILISGMVIFSPYNHHDGFEYKLVIHTITIQAPVDSVFRFLGNSENARRWSVFVHHISPLNADSVPDGQPGSRRRAYCTADEKGRRWDELVTVVEPDQRRQLITYDYKEFPLTADGLATEQIYRSLPDGSTELSFTLFYLDRKPGLIDQLKTHYASYTVLDIYKQNMNNIKRIIETGQ